MTKKKKDIQPLSDATPIYPIGVAATILDVHPRTLRIYEEEGLIKPTLRGSRRMFSQNDLKWVGCMRSLIHDEGISIPGLKKLLLFAPCWEIAECSDDVCNSCTAKIDLSTPRTLRIAGDAKAKIKAKEQDKIKKDKKKKEVSRKKDHVSC